MKNNKEQKTYKNHKKPMKSEKNKTMNPREQYSR